MEEGYLEMDLDLVSIDEMLELAKGNEYGLPEEMTVLHTNEMNGLKYTLEIRWWEPHLLRDHLLVELCMSHEDVDWELVTHGYDLRMVNYILYLWYNPLVWGSIPEHLKTSLLIAGRVAETRFVHWRLPDIDKTNTPLDLDFHTNMLDWFMENQPRFGNFNYLDFFDNSYTTVDILLWYYLTTNDTILRHSIEDGGDFDLKLLKRFDAMTFLQNMEFIAGSHGEEQAAELVRMLQQDWDLIEGMKLLGLDCLTPEQVADFREGLFKGMNPYLDRWDKQSQELKMAMETAMAQTSKPETPQEETPNDEAPRKYFPLLTKKCIESGEADRVEASIKSAYRGEAAEMWKWLELYSKERYIEQIENRKATDIFRALSDYFGKLPYEEHNFREARRKLREDGYAI